MTQVFAMEASVFWELNLNWLTDQLAVGGRFPIQAAEFLATELGVGHVVDLRLEDRDEEQALAVHGVRLLHLPTPDMTAPTQETLWRGVDWIAPVLARGERVYIHCEYGIGRSAVLALCVLVDQGLAPLDALSLAKARRPVVAPGPKQLAAFIEFLEAWREKRGGAPWVLPTREALQEIAYVNLKHGA